MKIIVASGFTAGTDYAHVINSVKHADAFAALGHEVTIICFGSRIQDYNSYYGLNSNVKWIFVPNTIFGISLNQHWHFALFALFYVLQIAPDALYTRTFILPAIASKLGFNVFAEAHTHLTNTSKEFNYFISSTSNIHFKKWITISTYLKKGYVQLGAEESKIQVLPDAVDFEKFKVADDSDSPYNCELTNIVYVGHLYDYKGISTIIKSASMLGKYQFHLVGGLPEDIARQKSQISQLGVSNVQLHGKMPHAHVPPYLWHADVLLLTHTLNHPAALFTSPVKLAEYLASKVPIVVSDIPALRDWLTEEDVIFAKPDDPEALSLAIDEALSISVDDKQKRAERCTELAKSWSYINRCMRILEHD